MLSIASHSLGVRAALSASRLRLGLYLHLPNKRFLVQSSNVRVSLRHCVKWLEKNASIRRGSRVPVSSPKWSSSIRYLFVFPLAPSVLSHSPNNNNQKPFPVPTSASRHRDVKTYSKRRSLVKYLYKTWDLIRFWFTLSRFVFLYSPFLLTYPVCYLSVKAEDLWWILFKKAIVLGKTGAIVAFMVKTHAICDADIDRAL